MKNIPKTLVFATGMAAVAVYVAHVVLGGLMWSGYSHIHQPISDLTATGAPNRALLLALTNIYGALALVFALSFTIAESRKHHRMAFYGGISFVLMHLISISYGFFPQDLPGSGVTFTGFMHLVVTALIVPFTILSPLLIGRGLVKNRYWKRFGRYSVITGILIFIFGGATALFFVHKLPYFGVVERINIGTLQLWTFIFSFKLTAKYSKP